VRRALGLPLLAAIAVTALADGGFSVRGQGLFVALCGAAVAWLAAATPRAEARRWRATPALVLLALGALACASAAWTIAAPADALRWGLVIVGYGALVAAGAFLAARLGPWPFAIGVCVLAGGEAVVGLIAVARRELPEAERIGGAWQAGGTFQYAPALAALQLMALPAALRRMRDARPWAAVAGAISAALAAAALGVSGSAFALAAGAALLAVAVAWPRVALGGHHPTALAHGHRPTALAAAALLVLTALAAYAVAGRYAPPDALGGDVARLVGLAASVVAAAALWLPLRALARATTGAVGATRPRARRPLLALTAASLVVAAVLATLAPGGTARVGVEPSAGFGHGRPHEWSAAARTWLDRPLLGAGATAYLPASRSHQGAGASLFAHDLPLEQAAELGVVGLLLALALYAACGAALWRARGSPALWLAGPAVVVFLAQNLIDWTWHLPALAGAWAVALGTVVAAAPADRPAVAGRAAERVAVALRRRASVSASPARRP